MVRKLVVLTGAGISAESGIPTFRDMGGLWENYDIMEVASPQAWEANPAFVQKFYNERRRKLYQVEPNSAHFALAELEKQFDVQIITQNIDDLHERAGSTKVLHLHGELKKSRSTANESLIYDIKGTELNMGDLCEKGSQLRPHIVWFGEEVPAIAQAAVMAEHADIFVVVGTSLNVYPAAGLLNYVPRNAPLFLVDPAISNLFSAHKIHHIKEKATVGMAVLSKQLI